MSPNISVHGKLTDKQINDLKSGVIQVSGKAMNRTALGVVDAMFKLYPNATFDEMKAMLPDSINPAAPVNFKSLFRPHTDRMYGVIQPASISGECEKQGLDVNSSHFTGPDETFLTSDGVKVLVSKCWQSKDTETGENNLQSLIDHVAQYGVKVVKFDKREYFKKGGYDIEVLNPVLMNILTEEPRKSEPGDKKSKAWIVILLVALLAGLFLFFFLKNNDKNAVEIKQDHVVAEQPENDKYIEVESYTVTPSAGDNGTIDSETPQTVDRGQTATFTLTPVEGYSASVGGTCGGTLPGTAYTTDQITQDCTVEATFTLKTYTVTPSAGDNGTIGPETPQTVDHGQTATFTVTPAGGYSASVGGTCGGTLSGTAYTTNLITEDCTVEVSFDPNSDTLTIEVDTATAIEELREDIASGISTESRSIIFHNILFEYDSDIILHESESDLLLALSLLNDFQDISIEIVGHTCDIGTREYNNELSIKRAKSVANYFIDNGISVTRIKTSGQGMDNPIVKNADELSRSINRRIEIIVTKGMHDET